MCCDTCSCHHRCKNCGQKMPERYLYCGECETKKVFAVKREREEQGSSVVEPEMVELPPEIRNPQEVSPFEMTAVDGRESLTHKQIRLVQIEDTKVFLECSANMVDNYKELQRRPRRKSRSESRQCWRSLLQRCKWARGCRPSPIVRFRWLPLFI